MKKITHLLFAVLFIAPTLLFGQAAMAKFSTTDTAICAPNLVYFTDSSLIFITSWKWYFPGGTPDTSTLQNPPPILYNSPGRYSVKLVVGNFMGFDSLTKTNYLHVYSSPQVYFTGPNDLCQGSQATITAYGALQYHWSYEGDTTSSINVQPQITTTYVVRVANGPCFKDTSFTIHVDTCLGISTITNPLEVSIYPNPASSLIQIAIEKPITETAFLSIVDITGRTLINEKINPSQLQLNIDVSSLSLGIYFVKFQTKEGMVFRKFVKD